MLSRYGYRFEEKDSSGYYYSYNPSEISSNAFQTPFYNACFGILFAGAANLANANSDGRTWNGSAGAENYIAYDTVWRRSVILSEVIDVKSQGFSL